jgi:hypothetical protein
MGRGWKAGSAAVIVLCGSVPAFAGGQVAPRDSEGRKAHSVGAIVTPTRGTKRTRFVVRFTARNAARGRVFYRVLTQGPEGQGCLYDLDRYKHGRRGSRVTIRLPAPSEEPNWCRGEFIGRVFLIDRAKQREKLVGRFRFRVRR